MSTVTNLSTLKINYLTTEQYQAAIEAGTINANELYLTPASSSGGSSVEVTPILEAGTKISTISVDGVDYDLYAPTPPTAASATPGKVSSSSSTGTSTNYARQDHTHGIDLATGDANGQVKIAGSNVSVKGLGTAAYTATTDYIASALKGANSGVAELDANGKVPSTQLPSYVDDVLEYNNLSSFPATGETGKIYIAKDTNKTYRWSGTSYVEISESLALGTTSSTAYRGDYGNTAYTHATDSSRITSTTSTGLYKVGATSQGHVSELVAISKSDITGLGIPGQDTTYQSKEAASGGTEVSLVTTGEKYDWNNKADLSDIPDSASSATTGISIANHGTTSITGVQSSTTTASKASGSNGTAPTLGDPFSVPNITSVGSASTWVFENITVPNAASSATTVPIKNASATSIPNVTAVGSGSFTSGDFNGGSGSFSATVTSHVLSFSHTHTAATHGEDSHTHIAPTLGTAISITGVQSSTTSVTGVSGSTTASHVKSGSNGTAPTLGTAFSIPNITDAGTASTWSFSNVTVPIKNASATTVVNSNTHTITDNGHAHNLG